VLADDSYDPAKTEACREKLMAPKMFALGFFCGHAHAREVCTAGGKVSLEGFVDAMVIVEGLKKAGKERTPEGLIRGIESVRDFDIGLVTELKLDYSAKDHEGFDHLIPTVIRGSRAVPFADRLVAAPHRSQIKRKCQRIAAA
jgi:hypothetical protein